MLKKWFEIFFLLINFFFIIMYNNLFLIQKFIFLFFEFKINYYTFFFLYYKKLFLKLQIICLNFPVIIYFVNFLVNYISLKKFFNKYILSNKILLNCRVLKILFLNYSNPKIFKAFKYPLIELTQFKIKKLKKKQVEVIYIQNYGNISSIQYDFWQLPFNKFKIYLFEMKLSLQNLKLYRFFFKKFKFIKNFLKNKINLNILNFVINLNFLQNLKYYINLNLYKLILFFYFFNLLYLYIKTVPTIIKFINLILIFWFVLKKKYLIFLFKLEYLFFQLFEVALYASVICYIFFISPFILIIYLCKYIIYCIKILCLTYVFIKYFIFFKNMFLKIFIFYIYLHRFFFNNILPNIKQFNWIVWYLVISVYEYFWLIIYYLKKFFLKIDYFQKI